MLHHSTKYFRASIQILGGSPNAELAKVVGVAAEAPQACRTLFFQYFESRFTARVHEAQQDRLTGSLDHQGDVCRRELHTCVDELALVSRVLLEVEFLLICCGLHTQSYGPDEHSKEVRCPETCPRKVLSASVRMRHACCAPIAGEMMPGRILICPLIISINQQ